MFLFGTELSAQWIGLGLRMVMVVVVALVRTTASKEA